MNKDYKQLAFLVKEVAVAEANNNAKAWAKVADDAKVNAYKYHSICLNSSDDKNKAYYIYTMLELQSNLMSKEAEALARAEALIAEAEAEVAKAYEALEAIKNSYAYYSLMNEKK
jgi:hypothetical protein